MPLYNYICEECGPFDSWETMSNAANACACPACSEPSARDVAAPRLNLMNTTLRRAMSRSEKSGSEPKVVKRSHLAGCGCALCKVGPQKPTPTRHKWMIGH
ncbi:FmdB family zinc ribbon protein [Stappia indica]|uniref:FmdB family zinc ribbon protein n=1 Tax=Stappia indica TaxID=538381 RepID=UPI001CD2B0C8|nr:FmdB family zinc ribbon protein [Stappia indica]MCA1296790.1 zinc ribbon domain-containing protein [Stappia indica]